MGIPGGPGKSLTHLSRRPTLIDALGRFVAKEKVNGAVVRFYRFGSPWVAQTTLSCLGPSLACDEHRIASAEQRRNGGNISSNLLHCNASVGCAGRQGFLMLPFYHSSAQRSPLARWLA